MLDFYIIGQPRSGTTWLANLFTDDKNLCYHDSLSQLPFKQFNTLKKEGFKVGTAETGAFPYLQEINDSSAPKLIIHRSEEEIKASLGEDLKLPEVDLNRFQGVHVIFEDIFDVRKMRIVYKYLVKRELNEDRFNLLVNCQVNPKLDRIKLSKSALHSYIERLRKGIASI